jgi:hypothetical protein
MIEPSPRARPWTAIAAAVAAIGACAVCYGGPILVFLGGLSIVSLAASIWIPALSVVAIAAIAATVWILQRRRPGNSGVRPASVIRRVRRWLRGRVVRRP